MKTHPTKSPQLNVLSLRPSTITGCGFQTVDIYVDGKPIHDFSRVVGSLIGLYRSLDESGKYEIVTCTCGIAECGRVRPTKVSLTKDFVKWTILDPEPGATFIFDKRAYAKEIARAIDEQGGLFRGDQKIAYRK